MLMPAAFLASALIQFALGLVVAWLLGPAEFGAYALALAGAMLVQTLVFEWIRLAATRFHHREDGGRLAASLRRVLLISGAGMGLVALGLGIAALGLAALGTEFVGGVRAQLLALVPLVALAGGHADFQAAMLRAEFAQRPYAAFMLARNLVAVVLLPLAAGLTGRAEAALGAYMAAIVVPSLMLEIHLRRGRRSPGAGEVTPSPDMAMLRRYALPIVATNGLYLALFFALRALVAMSGGLAVAGQMSLALDFTLKLFSTVGTALDLLLFQRAVQGSRERGEGAGDIHLRANAEMIAAVLLPMAFGLALVIGHLEPLLVGPGYRGAFSAFVIAMLPGIALYSIIQYVLHPYFQLGLRTRALIAASGGALVGTVLLVGLSGQAPANLRIGIGLAAGMALALAYLVSRVGWRSLPDWRFALRLAVALGAMSAVTALVLALGPGPATLGAAIVSGALAYGGAGYLVDLAGMRRRDL